MAKSNETDQESTAWPSADRPFPEIASALRSQANQIAKAWADAVRAAIPPAIDLPSLELQEHLPAIITKMADAMDYVTGHGVDELKEHSPAQERMPFQHRNDVRALMTEDRLLRRVVIERVKVEMGRQMTPTERAAMNTGIDTMLREAMRAQHGWADRLRSFSKQQAVVMPTSTPIAQTQSSSSSFSRVIETDSSPKRAHRGNSMSLEKPSKTSGPILAGSLAKKAAIPVFVELPAQPQAQVATSTVAELIRALQDLSADTACEAAIALGKLGERAAVFPLIEVVENRNGYFHAVVRVAACASLGQLGDRSATPALLSAINDPMAEVSGEAIRALAALGDEDAGETLIAVLQNADGFFLPVVRLAGVTALRDFNSPWATAARNAVAADVNEDPVLRAAAAVPEIPVAITHESIAVAAYYIWEKNGRQEGRALQDWLQAEVQLTAK